MDKTMILFMEIYLYSIYCISRIHLLDDVPSFLEIAVYVAVMEFLKTYILTYTSRKANKRSGIPESKMFNEDYPTAKVKSVVVWKICLALNLKAELDTGDFGVHKQKSLPLHEDFNEPIMIPQVHSFMVFKICEALDLKVQLASSDVKHRNDLEKQITVPIVHSEFVWKMCLALGFKADLAPTE
ncbi:hypothetical protein HNY73_008517 [Argiope bruennichi]|uniref:Uncharacterized protein n=1 Tax=Argiope bruennichi TaxID=94029 RepID=A0A8T0F994_ARGBR|nr:hypothetical protein HNY73_008517 [Argiope bruennichi]